MALYLDKIGSPFTVEWFVSSLVGLNLPNGYGDENTQKISWYQ